MKDVVLEWYIPYVMPKGKRLLKAVLTAAMVVLMVDTIIYPLLFLPVRAFVVIGVLLLRSWRYEYEYVYVNGDFQVSKIIRKEKRKELYRGSRAEIEEVERGRRMQTGRAVRDFTSNRQGAPVLTLLTRGELLYVEPNAQFEEEMKRYYRF